jgi:hypothetical protein
MPEYQIKLEAIREYQEAIRARENYEELTEVFTGIVHEIIEYCEENGIPLAKKAKYLRILSKAEKTILSQLPPTNVGQPRPPTEDGTDYSEEGLSWRTHTLVERWGRRNPRWRSLRFCSLPPRRFSDETRRPSRMFWTKGVVLSRLAPSQERRFCVPGARLSIFAV